MRRILSMLLCFQATAFPVIQKQGVARTNRRADHIPLTRIHISTTHGDCLLPMEGESRHAPLQDYQMKNDTAILNPLEALCLHRLDRWYSQSQRMKCPFHRRRAGDILDHVETFIRQVVVRKECSHLLGPLQRCRPVRNAPPKQRYLSMNELAERIRHDWCPDALGRKGYYVTGRLNTAIYRDDCLFDGPDPDMPVQGLRKYLGVASQLFDSSRSWSRLVSLSTHPQECNDGRDATLDRTIRAEWEMKAIIKLPWRPELPVWSGTTTYHVDPEGLIYWHEEAWHMSVFKAFCYLLPGQGPQGRS